MATKHFGPVIAQIDEQSRRIELAWDKERRQPIGDYARSRALDWAISRLAGLQAQGYTIDRSQLGSDNSGESEGVHEQRH